MLYNIVLIYFSGRDMLEFRQREEVVGGGPGDCYHYLPNADESASMCYTSTYKRAIGLMVVE